MPDRKLHIIAFDVPFPPDYGGAVDLFYKIKSLAEAGCSIYLHCYEYGRGVSPELARYCAEVHYYKRTTGIGGLSLTLPYIVSSRRGDDLLRRLQEVDAPILFEGVHSTFFLSHPSLSGRFKAVRTHNVEHQYYLNLAANEPSFARRIYFRAEAMLLKKYESNLRGANAFFALSLTDRSFFAKLYPDARCTFIAPFHPYDSVDCSPGGGTYCLYHGNLSHPENREAVLFLLKEVIPYTQATFIVAGKRPAADVITACSKLPNCSLLADPDDAKMKELVANAHVHVLPTFRQSGMKLKLLSALFGGRHVLVNTAMLAGTGLEDACHIADDAGTFIKKIDELMLAPFSENDKREREHQLAHYMKKSNAARLLAALNIDCGQS